MANSYNRDTVTPYSTICCGLPITTFTASCLSGFLYLISIIIILATKCTFDREVIYFFVFLLFAIIAMTTMAGINVLYPRYRFNCLSLTISLIYSGSAALIIFGLIMTAVSGLCMGDQPKGTSLFKSGNSSNFAIWFITLFGLFFQLVAHYFYG